MKVRSRLVSSYSYACGWCPDLVVNIGHVPIFTPTFFVLRTSNGPLSRRVRRLSR